MTGIFIRGLWGDALTQSRPRRRYAPGTTASRNKSRQDVADFAFSSLDIHDHLTVPERYYAWGWANEMFLNAIGLQDVRRLSDLPLPVMGDEAARNAQRSAHVNWGVAMSRLKFDAILDALRDYPACVWLDWDVRTVAPVPADFWQRMAKGRPLQTALRQGLRNPPSWWRKNAGRRFQHDGAFIYVRGTETAQRLRELADEHLAWTDEMVIGLLADEMQGGRWRNLRSYVNWHYVPYCYDTGSDKYRATGTRERIFVNTGK